MRMQYRVCPYCDSNLDPEERCDCQDEQEGKFVGEGIRSGADTARYEAIGNSYAYFVRRGYTGKY